ncbi:MAG: electron transfer flavoprotein subunit beta/FixA family protein [Anaerolineales bacterium]|nr:electron transfer flavoprotein subunit beta/FixA family protein [Anaerolineales bacterium]
MNIVVCVKQVPDTAAKVIASDGQVSWGAADLVINPWDEYAVEAALLTKEEHGGEVTAVTISADGSNEALKQALAMGCDNAILVSNSSLPPLDSQMTARILAAAIQKVGDVSLVFFGRQAIDGDSGLTHAQTARALGWPALMMVSSISSLDAAGGSITVERAIEEGRQILSADLPAVLSVIKDFAEPRYPSFMGIRKAAKAEVPVMTGSELGLADLEPKVSWPEISNPPTREVVCEMIEGAGPDEIAASLAEKIIAEKVL